MIGGELVIKCSLASEGLQNLSAFGDSLITNFPHIMVLLLITI